MSESKRRGRPNKFADNPKLAKAVAKAVEDQGTLAKARTFLAETGVKYQPKPGVKSTVEKVEISIPTLAKVARDNGVTLKRGRPAAAKAA